MKLRGTTIQRSEPNNLTDSGDDVKQSLRPKIIEAGKAKLIDKSKELSFSSEKVVRECET